MKDGPGKETRSMNFASIYGDSDNENKLLYNREGRYSCTSCKDNEAEYFSFI